MKFAVNDKVYCKRYGKGALRKIDPKDKEFTYLVKFKDGTLVWLSKFFVRRYMTPAKVV